MRNEQERIEDNQPQPNLRANALGLPSVVMQAVTHIAPAAGVILSVQFIVSYAGVRTPMAYALAFLIVLTLGFSLTQLARHLPSAGGYFTYVSRTVHPRAGFLTAWLYFLYDPVGTAINLAFMGLLLEKSLLADFGIFWFPWWLFLVLGALLIGVLTYRGIEISARLMMLLGILEIVILLVLAVAALMRPGPGDVNLVSYSLPGQVGLSGVCLGVVFAILSFTGFESVAPLAEESRAPRRNLPRAILSSITLMGLFYLFCSWAVLIGWGTNDMAAFVASEENPVFLLAGRIWTAGKWVVLIALLNSVIAVSIACTNAATRVFFAMGRAGALPRVLARVHPQYQTPSAAVLLQTFITLAVGLGLGFSIGPDKEFELLGLVISFGVMVIYSMGNLGVFLFFLKERRAEFGLVRHAIMPFLTTIVLMFVGYQALLSTPDHKPACYAPWIVVTWLSLGIVLLVVLRVMGRERWLLKAGEVAYGEEHDAGPEK
jgi:amino acid transporter